MSAAQAKESKETTKSDKGKAKAAKQPKSKLAYRERTTPELPKYCPLSVTWDFKDKTKFHVSYINSLYDLYMHAVLRGIDLSLSTDEVCQAISKEYPSVEWQQKNMEALKSSKITDKQRKTVIDYQGSGYTKQNGELRKNPKRKAPINDVINKMPPLDKDIVVYRYVQNPLTFLPALGKKGGVFHSNGYMSTTFDPMVFSQSNCMPYIPPEMNLYHRTVVIELKKKMSVDDVSTALRIQKPSKNAKKNFETSWFTIVTVKGKTATIVFPDDISAKLFIEGYESAKEYRKYAASLGKPIKKNMNLRKDIGNIIKTDPPKLPKDTDPLKNPGWGLIRMRLPKGTRVLYIPGTECEILLPHDINFKVVSSAYKPFPCFPHAFKFGGQKVDSCTITKLPTYEVRLED